MSGGDKDEGSSREDMEDGDIPERQLSFTPASNARPRASQPPHRPSIDVNVESSDDDCQMDADNESTHR
jgi:hypothetical protein